LLGFQKEYQLDETKKNTDTEDDTMTIDMILIMITTEDMTLMEDMITTDTDDIIKKGRIYIHSSFCHSCDKVNWFKESREGTLG
jgi:hypothetical protein